MVLHEHAICCYQYLVFMPVRQLAILHPTVCVCLHAWRPISAIFKVSFLPSVPFCLILAIIFSTETLSGPMQVQMLRKDRQKFGHIIFYAPNPMIGNHHVPCCIAVSDFRFPFSDAPTSQSRLSQELDSPRTRCRIGTT